MRSTGRKGRFVLLTGLPCSGKTTIAELVKEYAETVVNDRFSAPRVQILDGDVLRKGLCSNLGFSREDRRENLRRVAEVGKLLTDHGILVLAAMVSPYVAERQMMKEIVGEERFLEVFVDTSLAECERRDVKGMYAMARRGEIKDFTGIGDPYEEPEEPDLYVTTVCKPYESASVIINKLREDFVLP